MTSTAFQRAGLLLFSAALVCFPMWAGPAVAAARAPSRIAPVAPSPTPTPYPQTLYVPWYGNNGINGGVYSYDGNKTGQPNGFLEAPGAYYVAVDDVENLYVGVETSKVSPSFVYEFYPGGTSYGFIYYTDVQGVEGLAVGGGASPYLDVANYADNPSSGEYGLLTFPQGVNQPSEFADPNLRVVFSVAIDATGDTYLGGQNYASAPEVDLVEPDGSISNLGLNIPADMTALLLDSSGNLLVAEQVAIAVFRPGETQPSGRIDSGRSPLAMAFGNGGHWLYVLSNVQCFSSPCTQQVFVHRYPQVAQGSTIADVEAPYTVASLTRGVALSPRVPLFDPGEMRRRHPDFKYWTDFAHRRAPVPFSQGHR